MSMSISTPPPVPPQTTSRIQSPAPTAATNVALPPPTLSNAVKPSFGPKPPVGPKPPLSYGPSRPPPSSGGPSSPGAFGLAGNKLKQAFASRRAKKATKAALQLGEEWEDAGMVTEYSPPVPRPLTPGRPTTSHQAFSPVKPNNFGSQSDVESGTVIRNQRFRVDSKLQALTHGIRKHHVVMSNPPTSPVKERPLPPPKPRGLQPKISDSNIRALTIDVTAAGHPELSTADSQGALTPRSSNSHMSTKSNGRPITPTMIAAQNVAAASSLLPGNVSAFAAKVVGVDSRNTLGIPGPNTRNSFQMPSTPSISAALSYMQNIQGDDEGKGNQKREKRRSGSGATSPTLRPVQEISESAGTAGNGILDQGALRSGPRAALQNSPGRSTKRRSSSLGDVFRGGFTPHMALAALSTSPSTSTDSHDGSPPPNAAQIVRSRPSTHRSAGSAGSLSTKPSAGQSAVAEAYKYINADIDQPAAFLQPKPPSHPSLAVTPAATALAVPSVSTDAGGIIVPPLPPRKRDVGRSGMPDGGENSATDSFGSKGSVIKNSIKGRLAAWTAAANATQTPTHTRGKGQGSCPPPAYIPPSSSASPSTPSTTSTPDTPFGSSYPRARSNSSHASPITNNSPPFTPPNPKRMTATGARPYQPPPHPHVSQSPSPSPPAPPTSYTTVMASTAGSIGAAAGAAGGLALHLGRRGWDRVGNFIGHRTTQYGVWGYPSGGEDSTRDSVEGTLSDSGSVGYRAGGTRMLGTLVRPPLRKGRGAVFGRRLAECVPETRIGIHIDFVGYDPGRGRGIWVTALVTRCIEHLMYWGMEEEGLFRITGRSTHVAKIRAEFDNGADYVLREAHPSDLDPHAVSSIFKAYLRELPEPILTHQLTPLFDSALLLGTDNQSAPGIGITSFGGGLSASFGSEAQAAFEAPTAEAMRELKRLVGRLPRENCDLLHEIAKLLRVTSINSQATKMPLSNLLLVFCPSIQLSPTFLKVVVEKQDYLFGDGDMGAVAPRRLADGASHSGSSRTGGSTGDVSGSFRRNSKDQIAQVVDDLKRTRTASIYLPPGFSITVEAFPEPAADLVPPITNASRPITPVSLRPLSPSQGLPPSTASSTSSFQTRAVDVVPLPTGSSSSMGARRPSTARRQPSLGSLFGTGSKGSMPVISGPLPIMQPQPETPSEPPTLDISLPEGGFSVITELSKLDGSSSSLAPHTLETPQTSDFGHFRLAPPSMTNGDGVPRPVAFQANPQTSSPPRLPMPRASNRISAGDWASSVLSAAGSAD